MILDDYTKVLGRSAGASGIGLEKAKECNAQHIPRGCNV